MKNWLALGFRLMPIIVSAVTTVEKAVTKSSGQDKEDAAVERVDGAVAALEGLAERELVRDADVQESLRDTIAALVKFQNVLATRSSERASSQLH